MAEPIAPAAPAAPAAPGAPAPAAPASTGGGAGPNVTPNAGGPTPGQHAAPAPEPKYLTRKEKIDGKEVELKVAEDELWASYRKGATVDRRFEEVALTRKQLAEEKAKLEEQRKALREGRLSELIRKERGDADPVEVLTAELQQLLDEAEQNRDPNVVKRKEAEARVKELELAEAKRQQEAQQAHFEAQVAERKTQLGALFTEGLKKVNLPTNETTVAFMAQAHRTARAHGLELTPEQLARSTEKVAASFIENFLKTDNEDLLLERFPNLTQAIHKALVNRYNKRKAQPPAPAPAPAPEPPPEPSKPRLLNSTEEHKAYGIKGLRTI